MMSASRPPRSSSVSHSRTFVRAAMMSGSEFVPKGSALRRMEPIRCSASWGIAMRRSRMVSRGRVARSMPSMVMVPESISRMRRMVAINELFPLRGSVRMC